MLEKIENSIKDLISALQIARLYGLKHHEFNKSLDKAYKAFEDIFRERQELIIGIIGGELAFEKEILFELAKNAAPLVAHLKNLGIERIAFSRKMDKEELWKFISLLTASKEEIKGDPGKYLSMLGVKNIAVGKIKAAAPSEKTQEQLTGDNNLLFESPLESVTASLDSLMNTQDVDYLSLKFSISDILESLMSGYQGLLQLVTVKRYDSRVFIHSLDVSILSMYFASKLGFSKEDILDLGIAALFHDVGKLYISRKVLNKPDKLTDEEFTQIKNHSALGAEILLQYADTIGILPAVVAFEHHLRFDLGGYPKLDFPHPAHIASLIVSICDVYDAIFQRRSYKETYPPNMVYELMIKERSRLFEPSLLDKFFKIMGVWPIGTLVYLSDQRVAVVRKENEDDIFFPQVEVISPPGKKETIDLKLEKERLKIEYSLNPLSEGKDYLSLI
jgi:putative nucleotidyltransferase with HDIG domain